MALGMGIGFVNAFLGIGFWPWGLASLVPAVLIYLVWFDRVWPKPRNGGSR